MLKNALKNTDLPLTKKQVLFLLASVSFFLLTLFAASPSHANDSISPSGSMSLTWNPVTDVTATNDQTAEYEARSDAGFKPYYHAAIVFREERPESGLGWALQISDFWQPFYCWPIGCKGGDRRALLFNRIAPEGGIRRITFTIDEARQKNAMFYDSTLRPRFRIFYGENPQDYEELVYPDQWNFTVSAGGVTSIEFLQPLQSSFVKLSVPDTTGGRDTAYFNTGPTHHFRVELENVPTLVTPGVPFTAPRGGKVWIKDENFSDQHFVVTFVNVFTGRALVGVKSDLHPKWFEVLTAGQSTVLRDSRLEIKVLQTDIQGAVTAVIDRIDDIDKIEAKNTLKQNGAYVFKRLPDDPGAEETYEQFSNIKPSFHLDASAFVDPADPVWPGLNLQKSHVMLEVFYEDTTTNDPADEDNEVELFTRNRWNPNRNQVGPNTYLDEHPEWMEAGQTALGDDRDMEEGGWKMARFLFPRDLFPRLRAFDGTFFQFAFSFDALGTTKINTKFVRLTEINETTLHYFQTRLWDTATEKNPLDRVHEVRRKEPVPAHPLAASNPFTLFKRPLIQRIFRHTVPDESERLTGPLSTFVAKGQKRVVNLGLRTGNQFVNIKSMSVTGLPHITVEPHYVHYTLRRYGEARTQYMLDEQPSILTKLSETNPADLHFKPRESHQFWLTVTPDGEAVAGTYTGKLTIKCEYNSNGVSRTISIPFSVEVLDFNLLENPIQQILAVDLRGEYYGGENNFVSPEGRPDADYQQPIVDDILDHGQTPRDTTSQSPHFILINGQTGNLQLDEYANWLDWSFSRGLYKKDSYLLANILHLHDQVAQALHGQDASFPDPYGLWTNGDYWWNQMADPRYKDKYKEVIRALHGLLTDPAGTKGGTNWRALYPHLEPLRPVYVNMDEPTKEAWIRGISYREAQIFHELKTEENLQIQTFVAWKVDLRNSANMEGTTIPTLFNPGEGIVFDRLSVNPGSLTQDEMTRLGNDAMQHGNRFGYYSTWYSSQDVPLNNYFSRLYAWRIKADHIREYHYRETQNGLLGHDSPFKGSPMHNTYAFSPASWGTRNPVTGEYTRAPLSTIAWEMVREGNNMSRYLATLKDRMMRAGLSSSTPTNPSAAYRVAEQAAAYVAQYLSADWWKDAWSNTMLTSPARINPFLADRYYKKAWTVNPYDEFEQLVLADWDDCYSTFNSYHSEEASCADYAAFEKFERKLVEYITQLDLLLNAEGSSPLQNSPNTLPPVDAHTSADHGVIII